MFILRGGSSFIVDLILDSHFSVLFPRFVFSSFHLCSSVVSFAITAIRNTSLHCVPDVIFFALRLGQNHNDKTNQLDSCKRAKRREATLQSNNSITLNRSFTDCEGNPQPHTSQRVAQDNQPLCFFHLNTIIVYGVIKP